MHWTNHEIALTGLGALVLITLGCSGAGGDALLGSGSAGATAAFALGGEIPIQEGLSVGAAPEEIRLDPCDPDAPRDADTGDLLGRSTIGAFVLDSDLLPVVGAEVFFSTSAGEMESTGDAVLTDERGLATDTLAVDETHAGEVEVTVETDGLLERLTVPVILLPKQPLSLAMYPDELWPPNHKMRKVTAVFDALECYPDVTFELVSVTSNEPDNEIGDGNTDDDIQRAEIGTPDTELMLRAERAGGGDGRTYTIVYRLSDESGATSMIEASVSVPHDQGH